MAEYPAPPPEPKGAVRHVDVHLLSGEPAGNDGDPYDLKDGRIIFRRLPFVALPAGSTPHERFCVARTWPRYPLTRLRILHAMDAAKTCNAHVYRLSLAVTPTHAPAEDALALACGHLHDKQRIVVASAGNWGPGPGTLSALAWAPTVITVGAVDDDGVVLPSSSRAGAGPCITVAADGIDPSGTLAAGTSVAASRVATLCTWLRSMLACLAMEARASYEETDLVDLPQPSLLAHIDSGFTAAHVHALVAARRGHPSNVGGGLFFGSTDRRRSWIHEVVEHARARDMFVEFGPGPDCVRRVLVASARLEAGRDRDAYGAGVVSRDSVRALLEDMTPSKFLKLFVDDGHWNTLRAISASRLDARLGPLWTSTDLDMFEYFYAHQFNDVFIEVGLPGASGHGDSTAGVEAAPMSFLQGPVYVDIDEHGNCSLSGEPAR